MHVSKTKFKFPEKYFFVVLICFLLVLGFTFFLVNADSAAKVQFTSDVILSLSGISDGDLYIASSSECTSINVDGENLNVNGIPDGSSFILKTSERQNGLKLTPSGGTIDLYFSSENLATTTGTIFQWALLSSNSPELAIDIGVPLANTFYSIKVGEVLFNSFESDNEGQVVFNYNGSLSSQKIFAVEEDINAPVEFDLTSPVDNYSARNSSIVFSWNHSDTADLDHYEFYIDGALTRTISSSTLSVMDFNLPCGDHDWYVAAVDKAGNFKNSNSVFDVNLICHSGALDYQDRSAYLLNDTTTSQTATGTGTTTISDQNSDDTVSKLKAIIADLLAKIKLLQSQIQNKDTSGTLEEYVFNKPLYYGQNGEDVEHLQIFLKDQGEDIYPEGLVTGYFGNLTEKAVIRFQLKYGIIDFQDSPFAGYVGPSTRLKINELIGK
jgi:peptidoglycan hydrolase-like protein with peptidoglycan-binding domain